jgi:hypothetical protein
MGIFVPTGIFKSIAHPAPTNPLYNLNNETLLFGMDHWIDTLRFWLHSSFGRV